MSRSARVCVAVAAALGCCVWAAPAGATRTEVARMPSFEPNLVAGGAVFFSPSTDGTRVVRGTAGAEPQTLTTLTPIPWGGGSVTVDSDINLAASESHVGVSRYVRVVAKGLEAENSFRIDAGPAAGPVQKLYECGGDLPIDIDGPRIAYVNGCNEAGGVPPVVIRDLSQPNAPTVAVVAQQSRVTDLDYTGRFVAVQRAPGGRPEIAVHDLLDGGGTYVVPTTDALDFTLQADGKLAVTQGLERQCRISWYSTAEPVEHRIEICPDGNIELAGDRVALLRLEPFRASLELVSLAGGSTQVATFGTSAMVNGIDFDGSRVAYAVSGCVSSFDRVFTDDLVGGAAPEESAACPVALSDAKVKASSSGLVRVRYTCERGCQGFLQVMRGGRSIVTTEPSVNRGPGSGKATLRLTSAFRKLLAERRSLLVQARIQAIQLNGLSRTFKRTIRFQAP